MSKRNIAIVPNAVALACALTVCQMGTAWAQAAASNDTLKLDEVVVTGTASGASKMKQSNSISTVGVDQILQAQPTNSADILRSIPGVRSESSGGGGNANVTVRGLPISAGGARYVQFQEDGLPVMLFGDVAFATPDMFLRADGSLERLEVVRGGSASTLGTNAPGGIINFISKTGDEPGGSVGISTGLGYDEKRFDFDYAGKLSDKTRFFVGGYTTSGQGPRNAPANGIQGHQIKANITQELDNGFVRLSFKSLDDKSPLFMPAPVSIRNGVISELPGIDPRKATFYSPYWVADATLTKNNTMVNSNVNDGLRVKNNAIGFETELKLANGWKLSEKFRIAENSGRFISIFPADDVANAAAGTKYATGPKKGQNYTGKSFTATVFNTSMDDMGATTNDVKGQISALRDLGALPMDTDIDAVIKDLRLDQVTIDPTTLSGEQLVQEVQRIVKALLAYGARMPKELMLYVKNMVFLDGAIARLAPDLDLLGEIANISMLFAQRHGEQLGRELGIDPTQVEINLDSVKAGLGVGSDVNTMTYRDLQKRREIIQKRMRDHVAR